MLRSFLVLSLLLSASLCSAADKRTPIWGEFSSSDATAATLTETTARISLFKMSTAGAPAAVTLAATDKIEIVDVVCGAPGTTSISIYDGSDDTLSSGDLLHRSSHASAGATSLSISYAVSRFTTVGTYPKVEASAAVAGTFVFIRGYLIEVP